MKRGARSETGRLEIPRSLCVQINGVKLRKIRRRVTVDPERSVGIEAGGSFSLRECGSGCQAEQ